MSTRGCYDALILGGGPAGCAAAIELARTGLTVGVVIRCPSEHPRRGETIAAEALHSLKLLGLDGRFAGLPKLESQGVMSLWGESEPLESDGFTRPFGHGWHVDRGLFDAMLLDASRETGADILLDSAPREIVARPGGHVCTWKVRISNGAGEETLSSPWLIDATGRRRWLIRRLGIAARSRDRLVALTACLDGPSSPDARLVLETEPSGWWYTIPLVGNRRLVVLMTDSDLMPLDPVVRAADWSRRLARTQLIAPRIGPIPPSLMPSIIPAATSCADSSAGPGWLAVGDASRTIDPLAGQGVRIALGSGCAAARVVLDSTMWPPDNYARAVEEEDRLWAGEQHRIYGIVNSWRDEVFWRRRAHLQADKGSFNMLGSDKRSF